MELCSVINAVIRDDVEEEIKAAVVIIRSINSRRVNRETVNPLHQTFPAKGQTWRGGGFRDEHRAFFDRVKGSKYRVPGFLATSSDKRVAKAFAVKADKTGSYPSAIWRFKFDPRGEHEAEYCVKHMTLVSKTLISGELEYLFAPYSVFTLQSIEWSNELARPHKFFLRPVIDNKMEDEELPLAPWY